MYAPNGNNTGAAVVVFPGGGYQDWHIDPAKVGVLGFSAGGHLAAAISNNYRKRSYPLVDAADKESCRPDFAIALYPGHLWMPRGGQFAFNPDIHVTRSTPSTFLLQAETDTIDNSTSRSSIMSR